VESARTERRLGHGVSRRARLAAFLEENGTLVVVLAAFAVALAADLRNLLVTDGWMALLSGREVAAGLPRHETLTIWAHGRDWIDQQWLAQVSLYGLDRLGGIRLVMLTHVFLATAGLAAATVLSRRLGGSARSVTWVCVVAVVAYFPGAAIMRPQSFAYLLFVAVIWILVLEGRQRTRRLYLVFPLLILWANLHGSVVLGAAAVGLFAGVQIVRGMLMSPRRSPAAMLAVGIAAGCCVLASPYAAELPQYYRSIFGGGFGDLVTEWTPTTLKITTVPFFLLVIGGAWLLGRAGSKLSSFEKLLFLAAAVLAVDAVRNMVWFALVAIVVLPRLVDQLRGPVQEPRQLNRLLATAMISGTILAAAGIAAKSDTWFTAHYPSAGADSAAAAAGADGRIFSNEKYSDWLLWAHPGLRGRVAFDSRFELLTGGQLRRVVEFRNRIGNALSLVDAYRVLVLDPQDESKVITSLVRQGRARVILRDSDVVVLRTLAG
jgi:hypothetical protein